jgi:hypothetical protein
MPRRRGAFYNLGYALGAAFGRNKSEGAKPGPGHSSRIIWGLTAGHSHRRTSGGKAEAWQKIEIERS